MQITTRFARPDGAFADITLLRQKDGTCLLRLHGVGRMAKGQWSHEDEPFDRLTEAITQRTHVIMSLIGDGYKEQGSARRT